MECYNSTINMIQSRSTAFAGEIPFTIPANTSAKCSVKFAQQFMRKPAVALTLSCEEGDTLLLSCGIEKLGTEGFTLHILNKHMVAPSSGVCIWTAQTF